MRNVGLLILLWSLPLLSFAQASFKFTIPAGLSVCSDTTNYQLKVTNIGSSDTFKTAKLTYRLPSGIRYITGSVSGTGVSESNVTISSAPVFSIPDLKPGDSVKLSLKVIADCDIISYINSGGVLKNLALLNYTKGKDSANSSSYSVNVPSLNISKVTNQTYVGSPGDTFSRFITFTNSANGKMAGFTFWILKSKDVRIDSIAKKYTLSGDTLKFSFGKADFKNIGNGDAYFDKNEKLILQEFLTIKGCGDLSEDLIAFWGCKGKACETVSTTANVIVKQLYPDLQVSPSAYQSTCLSRVLENKQSLTITNNGNGPALNVVIDVFQTIYYPSGFHDTVQSRIDESSIKIKFGSSSANSTKADTVYKTTAKSCLSYTNPIGRFIKIIPEIKSGETVILSWDVYNCCIASGYINTWGYNVDYTEQCKSKTYTTSRQAGSGRHYQNFSPFVASTKDLMVNDTVPYLLMSTGYNELFAYGNKPRLVYEITFPAGVKYNKNDIKLQNSTGTKTWKASSAIVSGSKVTLTYSFPAPIDISNSYLEMGLAVDTSGSAAKCGDSKYIILKVKYTADDTCSCTQTLIEDTFSIKYNCSNPKQIGLQNLSFKAERTSLGLPDNNDDGQPDASGSLNLSKIATDRVMYGDTFKLDFKGVIRIKGIPTSWDFGIADIKFSEDYFTLVGFEIRLVDSTNSKVYSCDKMPYYEKSGSNYRFFFHYDSLEAVGCSTTVATSYRYRSGDSVQIKIYYKVTKNNGGIKRVRIDNVFFFGNKPNPTKLKDYFYIDNFPSAINVVGYYHTNYGYPLSNHTGCSTVDIMQSFYLSIGPCCSNYYGGNMFPYEYRNWSHLSSYKVLLPKGYTFISALQYYYPTQGTGKYGVYTSNVSLSRKSGDTLIFNTDSLYKPYGGSLYYSDDGYAGTFIVKAGASCEATANVYNNIYQYQTFEQTNKLSGDKNITLPSYSTLMWQRPNLSIQPALQTVNTYTDTFSWQVYLSNLHGSADINKAWIGFESDDGEIIIDSVLSGSGSGYIKSNDLFKLDALKAGATIIVTIKARTKACIPDSIKLIVGWNCDDYPDSISNYKCPTEELTLYSNPQQPGIRIKEIAAPDSLYLCDTAKYVLEISNAKQGFAKESEVYISLVPGTKILKATNYLEYPSGNTLVKISDPDSLNPYLYRFKATKIISDVASEGLPGITDTSKNTFRVHFDVVTDCDYISGSLLQFSANSFDLCNNEVNKSTAISPALNLRGAISPYFSRIRLRNSTINACGKGTEIIIRIDNLGNNSTDTTDNIFITLPKGLKLDETYFRKIKNAPQDSTRKIITFNDQTRVEWLLPSGIVSGDSIVFALWLKADADVSCSNLPVLIQATTKKELTCVTNNTKCLIKIETGKLYQDINIRKPVVSIDSINAFAENDAPNGEKITIYTSIKNNGDTLQPGNGQIIRFYFDTDNNKKFSAADVFIGADTLKKKLYPGSKHFFSNTYMASAGKNCALIAFWDSAGTNCSCSPDQLYFGKIPILNAGKDTAVCFGDSVQIGLDSIKGYKYNWFPGNLLADSTKSIATFKGINNGTNTTTQRLILTTTRAGGCATTDTVYIKSYPKFVIDAGFEKTICKGGTAKLGDYPTFKGGSGKVTYTWSPKNGLDDYTASNPKASPSQTTVYKLTVTQNGCSLSDSIKVIVLPVPTVNAGNDKTICKGDMVVLGGSIVASGAQSPYSYEWNPSTALSSSTASNPSANPSSTTNYVLTVTDANGCIGYDTVTVKVNKNPVADAGNDADICAGDSIKLGGKTTASGSIFPYTYIWKPGTGLSDDTIANPYAKPTSTTTYIVNITDANGCKSTDSIEITVNSLPVVNAGNNREICKGDTAVLGGNPTANGGSGTYTYLWLPNTNISSKSVSNPKVYPKQTTTYLLKVTDAKGCIAIDSVKIIVNDLPIIEAGKNDTICENDTIQLQAASGGNYTYSWSPGKWMKDSTVLKPYIYPAKNASFVLTAKDAKGCIKRDTLNIFVRSRKALDPPVLKCVSYQDSNKINTNWDTVASSIEFQEYRIYRIDEKGNTSLVNKIADRKKNTYADIAIDDANKKQYKYFLSTINKCQIESKHSDTIGTIILKTNKIGDKTLNLSWTAPYSKTLKYALESKSGTGYKLLDSTFRNNYQLKSCASNANYRISAILDGNCVVKSNESNKILLDDATPPANNKLQFSSVKNRKEIQLQFSASDSADVDNYEIYRSENGAAFSLVAKVKNSAKTISFTDTGLNTNSKNYAYKIKVKDTCGNISGFSNLHSPVLLQAEAGNYEAKLNWNKYVGFTVKKQELQLWKNGNWQSFKNLSASDSEFIDMPLTCNVTRYYRIKSISKDSAFFSFSDSVLVMPFDTVKPQIPVINYVNVDPNTSVTIAWNKVPDLDVRNYIIYRRSINISYFTAIDTVGNTSFFTDSFANVNDSSWRYAIAALDSCAMNQSEKSVAHNTILLLAKINGCEQAAYLNWNAYDGWKNGVKQYYIYRIKKAGNEILIDSTNNLFWKDSSIDFHNRFTYRVAAKQNNGNGISSSNTKKIQTIDPGTPEILYATKLNSSINSGEILVKWNVKNPSIFASYRKLFYRNNKDSAYKILADNVPLNQDSFLHSGLNTRVGYHDYFMQTVDSCGNISDSSTNHTPIDLTVKVGQLVHEIHWSAYKGWPKNAYVVQKWNGILFVDMDTIPGTDTADRKFPAPCNSDIYYRIKAIGQNGQISYSDTMGGRAIDTIPADASVLKNVSVLTGNYVKIDFVGADSADIYAYAIQRGEKRNWTTAGEVLFSKPHDTYTFTDSTATWKNQLCYTIITLDSCLNATSSDTFCTIQLEGQEMNLSNQLNWNPFIGYNIDTYNVEIYNQNKWDTLATFIGTDTSYFHAPLPCNVPVIYRISGIQNGGLVTYSDTLLLMPYDTIKPQSPVLDYISVIDDNSFEAHWQQSADNDVKLYELQSKTENGNWEITDTLDRAISYIVSGKNTLDSTYLFRVVAIDSCAENRSLPSVQHRTIQLKGEPHNLSNLLQWNNYKGFSVSKYYIYEYAQKWFIIDSVAGNSTKYWHDSLACNVPHIYKVAAIDNSGKFLSYSDSIILTPFDTIKPAKPSLKYTSVQPDHSIKIAWNLDEKSDVKYFEIWKNEDNTAWKKATTIVYDSQFVDTQVNPQKSSYQYYVIAVDSCNMLNRSTPSDTDKIMNLKFTTGGCIALANLSWNPYIDLPQKVDKYDIMRSTDGINFNVIASNFANSTFYKDTLVEAGKTYQYKIKAIDLENGYESFSDTIAVKPWIFPRADANQIVYASIKKTGKTDGEISINWQKYNFLKDTFARGYNLYRATLNSTYKLIYTTNNPGDTAYTDVLKNTSDSAHFYYVTVYNSCNLDGEKSNIHSPVNLAVENKNLEEKLSWNTYKGAAVSYYEIYKSSNGKKAVKIATLSENDTVYSDTNIVCEQFYSYQVFAYLSNGNISKSDIEKVKSFDTIPPKSPDIFALSIDKTSLNGQISLVYTGNKEKNRSGYRIFMKNTSGNFIVLSDQNDIKDDTVTFTGNSINTLQQSAEFYAEALDSCGNISMPSDTHKTVFLTAKAYNKYIQLNWSPYIGFQKNASYIIQRRKQGENWTEIAKTPFANLAFADSNVECHIYYDYKILAVEDISGANSYSNIAGDTAFENDLPEAPEIKYISVSANNKMLVKWRSSLSADAAFFHLFRSDDFGANWFEIATKITDSAYIDSAINAYNNVYWYKLQTEDKCGNLSAGFSEPHGSVKLRAKPGNEQVNISWNAYLGWLPDTYKIYRDGKYLVSLPGNILNYTDTNLLCTDSYSYKIVAFRNADSAFSWSNADSAKPLDFNKPQKVYLKAASVSLPNKNVTLAWEPSKSWDTKGYKVWRKSGITGFYEFVDSTSGTGFTDSLDDISASNCYFIEAYDYCGNRSDWSNPGCIIILYGESKAGKNTLNWNTYETWKNGVYQYQIYRNADSSGWENIGATNKIIYEDIALPDSTVNFFCYKVQALENGTNINSFSTVTCMHQEPVVYIPNAFSPDASGYNDVFRPDGLYIKSYNIQIYNRWGEMIYENKDAKGWNGIYKNALVPEGLYMYKIIIESFSGEKKWYDGTVMLLR